jgi:DNA-binding MarR family transcriptional regulator
LESAFRVVKAFKRNIAWDAGRLTRTQLSTLAALDKRSPRRISSLAEESRSDLSVLSRQIAALEATGLVERTRDPEDGRASLVALTDQGRRALDSVWNKRISELQAALADVADADLARVTAVLERIAAYWENRPAGPSGQPNPTGPPP